MAPAACRAGLVAQKAVDALLAVAPFRWWSQAPQLVAIARHILADKGYDADAVRLIEHAFCRLKDFRRIATRCDKLAANFLSAIALATLVAYLL